VGSCKMPYHRLCSSTLNKLPARGGLDWKKRLFCERRCLVEQSALYGTGKVNFFSELQEERNI
jgi:hypothetical protein